MVLAKCRSIALAWALLLGVLAGLVGSTTDHVAAGGQQLYTIEGKVVPPEPTPSDWNWSTTVLIDGGKKVVFIKVK